MVDDDDTWAMQNLSAGSINYQYCWAHAAALLSVLAHAAAGMGLMLRDDATLPPFAHLCVVGSGAAFLNRLPSR